MVIDTVGRIWAFAIITSLLAMVWAIGMNTLVFPSEIWSVTMRGTAIIAPIVAFPICMFVAIQIRDKALISHQLQDLVNRDRLTDAATRDFFFAQLEAMPESYGVSLMVDIDHFKEVNDTYGHLAGDAVIHDVAKVLREQVREQDIVCRFGGEEFVIFLREATEQEGWAIAERIREGTAAQTTSSLEGDIKVTVSLGGSLKDEIEHMEEAIRRADECLYRAKSNGRNCTVVEWGDGAGADVASAQTAPAPVRPALSA